VRLAAAPAVAVVHQLEVAMDGGGLFRGPDWKAPVQQAEGYMRRLGEKRKIVTALGNNAANATMPRH
jgi:hypothetical protein